MVQMITAYPALDEIFTLTITKLFTGLDMIKMQGIVDWEKFQFIGKEITEPQTKQFKLVKIGYQPNFESVRRKLLKKKVIPQGQWIKVFKNAYPTPDDKSPIGIADASWRVLNRYAPAPYAVYIPCISEHGNEEFYGTNLDFNEYWRWLVEVP